MVLAVHLRSTECPTIVRRLARELPILHDSLGRCGEWPRAGSETIRVPCPSAMTLGDMCIVVCIRQEVSKFVDIVLKVVFPEKVTHVL